MCVDCGHSTYSQKAYFLRVSVLSIICSECERAKDLLLLTICRLLPSTSCHIIISCSLLLSLWMDVVEIFFYLTAWLLYTTLIKNNVCTFSSSHLSLLILICSRDKKPVCNQQNSAFWLMKSSKKAVCCFFVVLYILSFYTLFSLTTNYCEKYLHWLTNDEKYLFIPFFLVIRIRVVWVFLEKHFIYLFHSFEFRWRIFLNSIDREGLLSNVVKRCVCVLTSGHYKLLPYKTKISSAFLIAIAILYNRFVWYFDTKRKHFMPLQFISLVPAKIKW